MAYFSSLVLPLKILVVLYATQKCNASVEYKLPTDLVPIQYFLKLRPIFDDSHKRYESDESVYLGDMHTAPGHVRITVSCVNSTNFVILHAKNLEINDSSITVKQVHLPEENELSAATGKDAPYFEIASISNDSAKDFLIIEVTQQLEKGNDYELYIDFVAPILVHGAHEGLYSINYHFNSMSEWRSMISTQFEPISARQMFPCFDEPIYKSPFEMVIGRTENFTALANAPLAETLEDPDNPGWVWDRFERTVKLPTYLLAIVVASGYSFSSSNIFRVPVRVYGPKEWIPMGHAQLAADYTAKLLKFFENKYEVKVNNPKVDSVWVPGKTNALECHGLILYGDQMLVMHVREGGDLGEIRFNFNVLAHEVAHIWFGNSVGSMWEDVWLKEGITTFVSYDGMNAVWPEMMGMNHMIYEVIGTALEYDGKEKSHPLRQPAYTKESITQNMDVIGYDKGAALMRMIFGLIGDNVFYKGLKEYLRRFQDNISTQHDLFECLQNAAGQFEGVENSSLEEIFIPWTDQNGFPVVRVSYADGFVIFSQEPWISSVMRGSVNSSIDRAWDIPVRYLHVDSENGIVHEKLLWLRRDLKEVKVRIQDPGEGWFLLANSDGAGYYRVLYDEVMATRLITQLEKNHSVFDAVARARLLDDQLNFGFEKYTSIESALDFTKYLGAERDSTVWSCILHLLVRIFMLFRPIVNGLQSKDEYISLRNKLAEKINQNVWSTLSNENETLNETRTSIAQIAGLIDEEISGLRNKNGLDDSSFSAFSAYMQPRVNATLEAITIYSPIASHPPGSANFSLSATGHLESLLIDWSCTLHTEWCLHYAFSMITEWASENVREKEHSNPNPIPIDVQAMLYCQIVDWFGEWAYDWMYTQYLATNDSVQEAWLACSLACSQENNSFYNLIYMLTEAHEVNATAPTSFLMDKQLRKVYSVPIQTKLMQHSEYGTLFMSLLLSLVSPHISGTTVLSYLGLEVSEVAGMFEYTQNYLWTGSHLQMVEDIVAADPELYGNTLNTTIQTIEKNMIWVKEFRENVTKWFQDNL